MKILLFIEKHQNAIAGTLIVHVLVFVWLNIQQISFYTIQPKEKVVATLDFSLEELDEIENKYQDQEENTSVDLYNFTSNFDAKTPTNTSNSKEEIEQEVLNELAQFEDETFLAFEKDNPTKIENDNSIKQEENQIIDASKEKMNEAIAKYYVKDRYTLIQKVPSYLCNSSGKVRLLIKVNQKGKIIDCRIDKNNTNTSDICLINNAINYTKKWKFNTNFNHDNRVDGWVEFVYLSQ